MVRTSFVCFFICISFVDYILAFYTSFVNTFSTLLILFIINILLPAQWSDYLKLFSILFTQLHFIINAYIYKTVYYITGFIIGLYLYIIFFLYQKHRLSGYSYMSYRYNHILYNMYKTPLTGVYYKNSYIT